MEEGPEPRAGSGPSSCLVRALFPARFEPSFLSPWPLVPRSQPSSAARRAAGATNCSIHAAGSPVTGPSMTVSMPNLA